MITLDSRTGSGELAPMFPPDLNVCVGHLDYGDCMFLGSGPDESCVTIGIERKAIKDLLNSMVTGRLSGHQLPGMVQSYNYSYILVEGIWRFNPDSGVLETLNGAFWTDVSLGSRRFMAKEVVSFLNTLAVKAGVYLVYSHTKRETVQVITALYHWWNNKEFDQHESHLSPSKTHRGSHGEVMLVKPSLVRRIAAELPMIGWGKSKAVAEHFPSVLHMCSATERQWRDIPGIGKGIASAVVEALRKEREDEKDSGQTPA